MLTADGPQIYAANHYCADARAASLPRSVSCGTHPSTSCLSNRRGHDLEAAAVDADEVFANRELDVDHTRRLKVVLIIAGGRHFPGEGTRRHRHCR